jgi:DNA (cytosine-5)-methyltransferase 1
MRNLVAEGRPPRIVAIENVPPLITSSHGQDFAAIAELLTEAGYVFGALVIDAALFVPQSRERVFIVAVRADALLPPELAQDGPGEPFHTAAMRRAVAAFPTTTRACWRWWNLPTPAARNMTLIDILDFDARCDGSTETRRIIELMEPLHIDKVKKARAAGGRAAGAVCFRMRNGKQRAEIRFDLAQALRTPGGGSSIQRFLLIGDDGAIRSRKPTARECARLMGLPESYKLPYSTNDAYQLTGDGVAVPVVAWLEQNLLSRLRGEARRS